MFRRFMFHGVYLLLVAFIAVLYDPHSGRVGFNPNAKSALIAGGIFAFLSFLWAFFDSRGAIKIPLIGGLISTGLLLILFLIRAVPAWIDYFHGDSVKWFAATTITLMIFGSLPLFFACLEGVRGRQM
jgi:hypothetical protein